MASASAAVVVWQTLHAVALYDVSFVLNTAARIAMGDVPYRDFPLPYPPLTFVIQAALIKLFGAQYVVSAAYAVLLDAVAALLTLAIVVRLVRDRWLAAALCLPVVALGIHDVLPNAFYDADATFVMLIDILVALRLAERGAVRSWAIVGAICPVVIIVKQNSGLAYCLLMLAACGLALLRERPRAIPWLALGAAASVGVIGSVLQVTAGLENVARWTVVLASTRLASSPPLFTWLAEPIALGALALLLGGALLMRWGGPGKRLGPVIVAFPFVVLAASAMTEPGRLMLLLLWPVGLCAGVGAAGVAIARGGITLPRLLPFVVFGVATAAFLSQGVRGSTYSLWPLLIVAAAEPARLLHADRPMLATRAVAGVIGACVLIAGLTYSLGEYRLGFVHLDGPVASSTYPGLAGLAAPGPFVEDVDEILRLVDKTVPAGDGIISFPGEEPLFYALGRRPRFPLVAFDFTVDPYAPAELTALRDATGVRWVLVKRDLQLLGTPFNATAKISALTDGFDLASSTFGYDLYRRR